MLPTLLSRGAMTDNRLMRRLVTAIAFLLLARIAVADTYPRQPGVDAIHYVFKLALNDASDEIAGETTVTIRFNGDGLRDVALDLTSQAASKGMTVASVRRAGGAAEALPFTHQNNRLRITMPAPSKTGQEVAFLVQYRGIPGAGLRIGANIYGERTMFSENWPTNARQWLPMIDHPYDKATGEFIVSAPSQYQVVANGLLIEEVDLGNNLRRTHWKQSVPISSWLFALGVARFSVHHAGSTNGVALQTWVFPQDTDVGRQIFEDLSRRTMDFFISHIGPYSYEKLANVEAAGLDGGTEHASSIFYGEESVASGEAPVVHEIAHQWWGNSVTERDWDDVWLSEGFATYFTLLFTEHDGGRDAFVDGLRESRGDVLKLEAKLPDTPIIHRNLDDMRRVLNGLVYEKAGWVLHMLRAEVGTDTFWAAIREYYKRYRNQNASTADLRMVFEQASGKSLQWFFDQWLTRPGVPRIGGTWRYDAAKKAVTVTLSQLQAADPFRVNVEVGIVAKPGELPRIERVPMTDKEAAATFAVDAEPSAVVIDPGTWLLMEPAAFTRRK